MKSHRLSRRDALALVAPLAVFACSGGELPTAPDAPGFATTKWQLVNSLADPGDGICDAAECTLREALADQTRSEIGFVKPLAGVITLDPAPATLVIDGRFVSISGPAKGIVIRRNTGDPQFGIVKVQNGAHVRLANLTITGGSAVYGGGIDVDGSELSLVNVTVSGNSAGNGGGGIFAQNGSKVFLTNSTVRDDSAEAGGGIFNAGSDISLVSSSIRNNSAPSSGGGIYNSSGHLIVQRSAIRDNVSDGGGGGILNVGTGTLGIFGTTIAGNAAPAGGGGGLANVNTANIATIENSTISGNTAGVNGGGIYNSNAAAIATNSTVSGNSGVFGGGIWLVDEGSLTMINGTVAENRAETGGGIATLGGGQLSLVNSLVALNAASNLDPDVSKAASTSLIAISNLVGDGTGSGITDGVSGNQVGTNGAPIDPKVGKLATNGGVTKTYALMVGSPAIDAASDGNCPETDQRGVARPQGAHCDIGSYERVTAKQQ